MQQLKIGFIGAGNMASAIICGIIGSKFMAESDIGICDTAPEKQEDYRKQGFVIFEDAKSLTDACDTVVIAVKPQFISQVYPGLKEGMTEDKLIISIVTGVTADAIKQNVGFDCKIVLAMPNTPLMLGLGATAIAIVAPATQKDSDFAQEIFSSAGIAVQIPADKINEIIPVSGSGPAFLYYYAQIIIECAEKAGIPTDTAYDLLCQTLIGSAKMLSDSGKTPEELIKMVCSPGGSTLAGLKALDDNGFKEAVTAASQSCVKRAYELAQIAKAGSLTPDTEPRSLDITTDTIGGPWYNKAVFYQISTLGFCGAPEHNDGMIVNRISKLSGWISHIRDTGADAVYFCPVFESDKHGYDTRDYRKIDCRLGTNEDFAKVCADLKNAGIHVVLDGVFNHVGRGFWAFQDVIHNKVNSDYKHWFYLDFNRNGDYNDGFWYEGWEGHYELVRLNLENPHVREYLFGCVKSWIDEFKIDGLRLDVAYMLNEYFMQELRVFVKSHNPEFFLLGEAIHGDYNRIVNDAMLDSCTNYECYKGIYSSFNDKNLFEIAHSLNRQFGPENWTSYKGKHLFNFVDNHDVSRLTSVLNNDKHVMLAYALMFSMPGIPCVYYGSEWGADGKKTPGSDANLRPCFEAPRENALTEWIAALSAVRGGNAALVNGSYKQIYLTNSQFVFMRECDGSKVIVAINADSLPHMANVPSVSAKLCNLLTGESDDFSGILELPPYSASFYRA